MKHWEIFAIATGVFWGIVAAILYVPHSLPKGMRFLVRLYQFIFNFIGGFAGWYCLDVFNTRLRYQKNGFGWAEVLLLILAIIGISGMLSAIIFRIPNAMEKYIDDWFEKAKRGSDKTKT